MLKNVITDKLPGEFSTLYFIYLFIYLRKVSPELTSAANPPLFLLKKSGPELTSMPIFLYFISGMPATTWLPKWCVGPHPESEPVNPGPPKWNMQT